MGKGNSQKQTQTTQQQGTSSTALDPVVQQQAYQNLNNANNVASNYNAPLQQAPAGFTGDQLAGQQMASQQAQSGTGNSTLNSAITGAQGVTSFQPSQVGINGYGAQGYTGATVNPTQGYNASQTGDASQASATGYNAASATNPLGYQATNSTAAQLAPGTVQNVSGPNSTAQLSQYLSAVDPSYQSSVIDPTLQALNKSRIMALQGTDAQAAQAGAFGGDRQGIADAQTNQNFADQAAQTAANLNLQKFGAATNLLQNDQGLGQQAALANQSTGLQAGTTNANLQQQTGLSNQGYQNQASQFGANAGNTFTLANQNAQNQAQQFAAQQQNQASLQNAAAQNQIQLANTQAQNQALQFGSGQGLQAQLANQGSLNQAGQFNATAGNQAGQFNAQATTAAQQANQQAGLTGAGLNLSGANALAGQAGQQQQMGFNNASVLQQQGLTQQQQAQNAQNIAYQNAQTQNQNPLTQLGIQQSALGLTPYGTTTNTSGSVNSNGTVTNNPGLGTQILQGVGGALTLGGLGQGIYNASDERLKTNISPMKFGSTPTGAMGAINKMKGVTYNWKGTGAPDMGLVAQDVQRAAPGAVKTIGGVKHISTPAMHGLLVEGMKQLDRKVNSVRKGLL